MSSSPCHKKKQGQRLLLFGFVSGSDHLSYGLDQLLGCLQLPIIIRIYHQEEAGALLGLHGVGVGELQHGPGVPWLPNLISNF